MQADLEEGLKQWLLRRDPKPFEGLDERSRRLYRRLVRRSLLSGVKGSLPMTCRLVGEAKVGELVARWIEESPPQTRLYWRLPLEFAEWVRSQEEMPHPCVGDLVHWEAVKLDVRNAPDEGASGGAEEWTLDPSARLGIYKYPVFRMGREDEECPRPLPGPTFVVVFRREERPMWRVLSGPAAQCLAQIAEGKSVKEGLEFLGGLYEEVPEEEILEELQILRDRGALR